MAEATLAPCAAASPTLPAIAADITVSEPALRKERRPVRIRLCFIYRINGYPTLLFLAARVMLNFTDLKRSQV